MKTMVIDEAFLSEIEALQTILKNNVAGMFGGNHQSKNFGSSCEFADYRDYMPGDDISKIDWNVYARFDKLYQKLYLDERQMHTKIYIDASRSMQHGSLEKSEQAIRMAAAFAYLSVNEMDKVSIYAIHGNQVDEVISGMVGKDSYLNYINKLNNIDFDSSARISEAILTSKIGMGDGYSILISDFLTDEDFERAIDKFAEKKRDILCVQILSRDELNPQFRGKMHLFDSENIADFFRKKIDKERVRAYKEALKFVVDRIKNYCESRGGHFMLVPAHERLSDVFFGNMVDLGVLK
ncbi:MAG: DUF58 domain-containing protein [Clostridia bacterium]|nr:DUF58 domain-containing protein [Clostridia bacterium]MBO5440123.1 DUF58 domain-containing protein [Clostridia bacterium]